MDAGTPYAVPADNPFRATPGARPRSGRTACAIRSASPSTARPATSTSATSGQSRVEEIDVGPRLAPRRRELRLEHRSRARSATAPRAAATARGSRCPSTTTTTARAARSRAASSTAAAACPPSPARYFFGDFCTGFVRSLRLVDGVATDVRDWTRASRGSTRPSSFGLDADGEIYVVDYDGSVFRLEPAG